MYFTSLMSTIYTLFFNYSYNKYISNVAFLLHQISPISFWKVYMSKQKAFQFPSTLLQRRRPRLVIIGLRVRGWTEWEPLVENRQWQNAPRGTQLSPLILFTNGDSGGLARKSLWTLSSSLATPLAALPQDFLSSCHSAAAAEPSPETFSEPFPVGVE